jgi:hypothetical protein
MGPIPKRVLSSHRRSSAFPLSRSFKRPRRPKSSDAAKRANTSFARSSGSPLAAARQSSHARSNVGWSHASPVCSAISPSASITRVRNSKAARASADKITNSTKSSTWSNRRRWTCPPAGADNRTPARPLESGEVPYPGASVPPPHRHHPRTPAHTPRSHCRRQPRSG